MFVPNPPARSPDDFVRPIVTRIASSYPVPSSSLGKRILLVCLAVGGLLSPWYLWLRYDVEPYVLVLGVVAAVAAAVITTKFTASLLAGLLYVGNFKTTAAVGLSFTDPTFIVLMLCCAGLLIECLLIFSGAKGSSLISLFRGQGRGVFLFVTFVLLIAVSEFYSAAPESGLIKLERIAVFSTLAFFAPFILFKSEKDLRQFLVTCVVLSLALSVRNVMELLHPSAAVLAGEADITRIGDGELIGATVVTLIYYRLFRERRRLQLACIVILTIGLAASSARSAAFSVVLVLAITSISLRFQSRPWPQGRILFGFLLVLVIAAATFLWIRQLPAARARLEHKQEEVARLLKGSFLPGGTAEQRMNFYRKSLVAISEKPILGWGVGGWGAYFLGIDKKAIPHNFILESAVEQGLIGCGSLLAFLLTTGSALRKIIRWSGSYYAFLMPAFLMSILTSLVTGELDNRLLWFWCGTIFAVSRMIQPELQRPRVRNARSY